MSSFTFDIKSILALIERFKGPKLTAETENLTKDKAIEALISQSIADNFDKEGPGWPPLKPASIRQSLGKSLRKRLINNIYTRINIC
jgi:hypothetical protein